MKKIKFSKLTIKNFRNINELEINFNDDITEISGKNGLGKTNTLSAIMWCLWGKDIYDTKQFVISPIIDGEEDNSINTVVKLVINDNYVVERSYCKRITSLKTGWIIDGKEQCVSITQSNYQKELLENLVDEETFKSLSNINYIPNLNWKDLKKLIFDLIGDISDNEVLLRDDFSLIEEYVTKFGIEQSQKLLQDTDKELSNDIKRLETEYQTLVNTKEKYVANEEDNTKLETRKQEIEKELYANKQQQLEQQQKLDEYNSKKRDIDNYENSLNNLQNKIEYNKNMISDYDNLYKQNGVDEETLRNNDVCKINNEISRLSNNVEYTNSQIEFNQKHLEDMKNRGIELKSKEIKIENSKCSACGQELPEEIQQETLNKLKEQQLEELSKIKQEYDLTKEHLEDNQKNINELDDEINTLNHNLEEIKTKKYVIEEETEKQKQIRVSKEQKEIETKELENQLEELNTKIDTLKVEFSKLEVPTYNIQDSNSLKSELDEINTKLATTITLNKISEDIDNTLKELDTKKDNKIVNKDKMQQVIKFNNVKADLLQMKVRNYFKILNFKTKDYTQTGEEVETFKICNDKGVEFKETNNGDKIALGLDLLQGIMKAKEIYVPIMVDNSESFSQDFNVENTQIIITKVVKGQDRLEIK